MTMTILKKYQKLDAKNKKLGRLWGSGRRGKKAYMRKVDAKEKEGGLNK